MSFTSVTLTGTIEQSPGVAASGATVAMTLSNQISDGTTDLTPATVSARCNGSGVFSLGPIPANDDSTTNPAGTFYRVTITYGGKTLDTFSVIVPHADAPTVNLFSLPRIGNPPTAASYGVASFDGRTGVVVPQGTDYASFYDALGAAAAAQAAAEEASLPLAGGTMAGVIAMGSHKITGLTNGSGAQDAAAFGQIPTTAASIGGLVAANNLSDLANAGSGRANLHVPALTPAACVATTNVAALANFPGAFDAALYGGTNSGGNPLTWTHTCSGTDRILLVEVMSNTGGSSVGTGGVSGVTYNGVALTFLATIETATGGFYQSLWSLTNPASGANSVVATPAGSHTIYADSYSANGVLQTARPGVVASFASVSTASSLTGTLTTPVNNCWTALFVGFNSNPGTVTAGAGTTLRVATGNGVFDSNGPISPAESTSLVCNVSIAIDLVGIMVSLAPAFPTIDGYTVQAGDLVLLTGQSTASQNGLWLVPSSGAWTRPTEFFSGAVTKGRTCAVTNGTANANTEWILDAPNAGITIDTSAQTWGSLTPTSIVDSFNTRTGAVSLQAADVAAVGLAPLTTEGDMPYQHSGVEARLGIGPAGSVLGSNGTDPTWTTGTVNSQSGTTYTLAITDASANVLSTSASPTTFTIPPNASVAFPVPTTIVGIQDGAGTLTFTGGTGVTVNGAVTGSFSATAEYGTIVATQISANVWVVVASNSAGPATTQTLTNKRITKRVLASSAPGATPTLNTDNYDVANFTGLTTAITSMSSSLSGTPQPFDSLILGFTDNGTPAGITWGTEFEASNVALPTTTVASTLLLVGFLYNPTTSKWSCVAVA